MKALEEIRSYFQTDNFAAGQGLQIDEARDGYAVCSVALEERHLNGLGTVHGGMIFTLADFAFAVAANCETPSSVTLSSNINYVRAPQGKRMVATCTREHTGRHISVYHIDIADELGRDIAMVTSTGYAKVPD